MSSDTISVAGCAVDTVAKETQAKRHVAMCMTVFMAGVEVALVVKRVVRGCALVQLCAMCARVGHFARMKSHSCSKAQKILWVERVMLKTIIGISLINMSRVVTVLLLQGADVPITIM
jgi:hypothetical protein